MKYLIGVDGGGTKTELVVCDCKGKVVSRVLGGSSNPNDVGKQETLTVIADLIKNAMPLDCSDLQIGLGISGLFTAGCETYLNDNLQKSFPEITKILSFSDKDSCLNCAYDGDGCIVIIGTGSVGVVRKDGNVINIGGGGYLVDKGLSGFDLGRSVLDALLKAEDGRGEKTLLTDLFIAKTGQDVRTHLKTIYDKGKPYIASFATLAFEGCQKGDKVSKGIILDCLIGFEELLNAVYKNFGQQKCEITLFGGLTKSFSLIYDLLSDSVKEKFIFKFPNKPIVYGLIKEFSSEVDFAKNFAKSYNEFIVK